MLTFVFHLSNMGHGNTILISTGWETTTYGRSIKTERVSSGSEPTTAGFLDTTVKSLLTSQLMMDSLITLYGLSIKTETGFLWFGTLENGISQYDGEKFVNFTTDDGLADNSVWAIHQDRDGYIWLGTRSGVSRYDGEEFVNFTSNDGLIANSVFAIHQDHGGPPLVRDIQWGFPIRWQRVRQLHN